MSKRPRFRTTCNTQHVEGFQTPLKSEQQHFHPFLWSIGKELSYKTSLLAKSEILGLSDNTLVAHDVYSLDNREKLQRPIQTQLCKKLKILCSNFYDSDLKSTQNFEHFERKRWAS